MIRSRFLADECVPWSWWYGYYHYLFVLFLRVVRSS